MQKCTHDLTPLPCVYHCKHWPIAPVPALLCIHFPLSHSIYMYLAWYHTEDMNKVCLAVAIIKSHNWNLRDYMFLFCTLITIPCYTSSLNMIVMLFSLHWVWGCTNVGMTDLWVNASLCPRPLCSSPGRGFEPHTPHIVSHTVITSCTARGLSSFNIFVFIAEISVSACLLSAGWICLHFQLFFSVFHLLFLLHEALQYHK